MSLPSLFKNPQLLDQALTHRSYLNEHPKVHHSNERLEFLGDAILELIITDHLYHQFPHYSEGQLTALRSALVKTETLAHMAHQLNLGPLLKLSRGEQASGGQTNPGLLADTAEAVIGALYLDQGLPATQDLISQYLLPQLPQIIAQKLYQDAKSLLQEQVQARGQPAPFYTTLRTIGPHHKKTFTVTVTVSSKILGQGSGPTKQIAQQVAAQTALEKLP